MERTELWCWISRSILGFYDKRCCSKGRFFLRIFWRRAGNPGTGEWFADIGKIQAICQHQPPLVTWGLQKGWRTPVSFPFGFLTCFSFPFFPPSLLLSSFPSSFSPSPSFPLFLSNNCLSTWWGYTSFLPPRQKGKYAMTKKWGYFTEPLWWDLA